MNVDDMNFQPVEAEDTHSGATGENPEVIDDIDMRNEGLSRATVAREEQQYQVPHEQEMVDGPQEFFQDGHGRFPRSPYLPFSILLPLLALHLPQQDMQRIYVSYRDFQARNVSRQVLVRDVRLYAGDSLLRRTIEIFAPLLLEYTRGMDQRRRGGRRR